MPTEKPFDRQIPKTKKARGKRGPSLTIFSCRLGVASLAAAQDQAGGEQ
jgi:hypothetical protein